MLTERQMDLGQRREEKEKVTEQSAGLHGTEHQVA